MRFWCRIANADRAFMLALLDPASLSGLPMRLVLALPAVLVLLWPGPVWPGAVASTRLALARELHALTAPTERELRAATERALGLVRADLLRRNPGREAAVGAVLEEASASALGESYDRLGETASAYWAEALGEDDLRAIVAFYRSPAGRRLIAATPDVSARTEALVGTWLRGVLREAIEQIVVRATEQGLEVGP